MKVLSKLSTSIYSPSDFLQTCMTDRRIASQNKCHVDTFNDTRKSIKILQKHTLYVIFFFNHFYFCEKWKASLEWLGVSILHDILMTYEILLKWTKALNNQKKSSKVWGQ